MQLTTQHVASTEHILRLTQEEHWKKLRKYFGTGTFWNIFSSGLDRL